MPATQRNYKIKDVDLLVTASTIIESALQHKKFLQEKRSSWADPVFSQLKTRIDNATQTHLGVDSAKDLRQATQVLKGIQKAAMQALSQCKIEIEEDFKKNKPRRNELLTELGIKPYYSKAQDGDQEALINLLYQFKTNMTAGVKAEIVAQGTNPETVDEIVGYADALRDANVSQESFKGQRKIITQAGVDEFNEIYAEVVSITRIASRLFKEKPAVKDQFSFTKVARTLGANKSTKK